MNQLRLGRLTVAKTLRLACGLLLFLFVGSMFLSLRSVRSIEESFDQVVSVDQPRREAATDMIASADAATISFLESLVSNRRVSSRDAEDDFDRSLAKYRDLVHEASSDGRETLARDLFTRLTKLGRRLVANDLLRQRSFVALQERFEEMDDAIEGSLFLAPIEDDLNETMRWVGNYVAAPSPDYEEEILEEIDDLHAELVKAGQGDRSRSQRALLRRLISDVTQARRAEVRIISLTKRSEDAIPHFVGLRSRLDRELNDGIDQTVHKNLHQRSLKTQQAVGTSKVVLLATLIPGLILGLGVLWWVRRRITQPVAKIMDAIRMMGAGQDLNELSFPRNDEFGVLARALREATSQMQESEHHLRTILETLPECVKLVGRRGELIDMNPAGLRMIEADTLQQVGGHQVEGLIHPAHRKAFKELNDRVFQGESQNSSSTSLASRAHVGKWKHSPFR